MSDESTKTVLYIILGIIVIMLYFMGILEETIENFYENAISTIRHNIELKMSDLESEIFYITDKANKEKDKFTRYVENIDYLADDLDYYTSNSNDENLKNMVYDLKSELDNLKFDLKKSNFNFYNELDSTFDNYHNLDDAFNNY